MKLSAAIIVFLQAKTASATLRGNDTEDSVERKLAGNFYVTEYGPGGYCTDVGTPIPGSRTMYSTMEECCIGQFDGQPDALAFCYSKMPNPPTSKPTAAPTEAGTLTVWYPDYENTSWLTGKCINDGPLPSGRAAYATQKECCEKAYGGQSSRACVSDFQDPPTQAPTESPTEAGTLTVFYPVYAEGEGFCTNDPPADHGLSSLNGISTSATHAECCKKHFDWQKSGFCYSQMANPPTQAPTVTATEAGTLTVFYPVYGEGEGFCTNDPPTDHGLSSLDGIVTSATNAECCTKHFSWQKSGFCFSQMANPPTQAPTVTATETGTMTAFYPVYGEGEGFCTNDPPADHGLSSLDGIVTSATNAECCTKHFSWQKSGFCFSQMANPPTQAPTVTATEAGTMTVFYPVYNEGEGFCTNDPPADHGLSSLDGIVTSATHAECCKKHFDWQKSGFCYSQMANPPTQAPTVTATEPGTLNEFYPIRNQGSGFCTNEPPSTYGLNGIYEQSYPTNAECCKAYFSHQSDGFCYSKMGSPPTQAPTDAPTEAGSLTVWYPDYSKSWDMGVCINDAPLPSYATHYNYPTQKECCDNAYAGQSSGRCAAGYLG